MEDFLNGLALAFGVAIVVAFIIGFPVMWLWNNALVGAIDGINPIGFWQAIGISFLSGLLVKSSTNIKNDK